MKLLFYKLMELQFQHIDPRVYELEKDIEFYHFILAIIALVLLLLLLIIYLQRAAMRKLKYGDDPKGLSGSKKSLKNAMSSSPSPATSVNLKDLPDPGLIFKYSLGKEQVMEKQITIGQVSGNIKTYSTEIIDDHLSLYIRILENRRDQDIYDLPDKITEEYLLDLRRDGKVLFYYPGLDTFKEMGSRERIYIKEQPDEAGDPTFPALEAKQPIRFRIGDRLNQDGKFINGYFEFHLFTQDYNVKTKTDIPKVEKNFLIRLYKIYPGYDTGSPSGDGLFPMVDPFTTG